jgi:excisionase family DNA binding protein
MSDRDTQTGQAPLSIGEVARSFGVSVDTIRVWDGEGKLVSFRTAGNQRRFTAESVDALRAAIQERVA